MLRLLKMGEKEESNKFHAQIKEKICEDCGAGFSDIYCLNTHIKAIHLKITSVSYALTKLLIQVPLVVM